MKNLGKHLILEFYKCNPIILDDSEKLSSEMERITTEAGGHILKVAFHQFSPQGVSGVIVISESHISIHTWPEHKYAAVDVFTCSEEMKLDVIIEEFKKLLETEEVITIKLDRGLILA